MANYRGADSRSSEFVESVRSHPNVPYKRGLGRTGQQSRIEFASCTDSVVLVQLKLPTISDFGSAWPPQ